LTLNPDKFTELDLERAQQTNDVILQIAENEERSAEEVLSRVHTCIRSAYLHHDRPVKTELFIKRVYQK
jgi:hypothetical protein